MRSQFASAALTLAVTLTTSPATAQTRAADRPADAAAIRAHIESIFQAFVDKDRAALAATHGAEWRGFTPWSGHVIRGRDGSDPCAASVSITSPPIPLWECRTTWVVGDDG